MNTWRHSITEETYPTLLSHYIHNTLQRSLLIQVHIVAGHSESIWLEVHLKLLFIFGVELSSLLKVNLWKEFNIGAVVCFASGSLLHLIPFCVIPALVWLNIFSMLLGKKKQIHKGDAVWEQPTAHKQGNAHYPPDKCSLIPPCALSSECQCLALFHFLQEPRCRDSWRVAAGGSHDPVVLPVSDEPCDACQLWRGEARQLYRSLAVARMQMPCGVEVEQSGTLLSWNYIS